MSGLRDLYQELILDHGKSPRNHRPMDGCTHQANGFNPVCGDKVNLYLCCEDGRVTDASFEGSGCAISTASASMLTQMVKGKRVEDISELRRMVGAMLTSAPGEHDQGEIEKLGKLAAFSGVCEFPGRVKCATLAWHTLDAALEDGKETISTE